MNPERAHCVVQIKRADAELRRITGIASTPTVDRQGDALEPMGAVFNLPLPLLWQHDHGQPIGQITDARATPKGLWIVAQIAAEGVSERIDEAWRLIRAGLVSGLSVGFIGQKSEPLSNGGRRFTKWEVIEISAVTVPANGEAAITEAKAADTQGDCIPPFPAHLTPAERLAVREKAAHDLCERTLRETAQATGIPEHKLREKMAARRELDLATAAQGITIRWHDERLAALEARISAMEGGK